MATGLSRVQANLFSDLAIHHMGSKLADGISQGNAGPDQFRTSPLWGLGQRLFFLHDGRTSNLVEATREYQSRGSEANRVINNFENLSRRDKQNLILSFVHSDRPLDGSTASFDVIRRNFRPGRREK
jgi:CxxC motif-containing protein (DUF1111 family)